MTPKAILAATAEVYGLTVQELKGPRRFARLSVPRQLAYYLSYKHTNASYPQIGRAFGRDHTTILHGVCATQQRIEEAISGARDADILHKAENILAAARKIHEPSKLVFRTTRKPAPQFTTTRT